MSLIKFKSFIDAFDNNQPGSNADNFAIQQGTRRRKQIMSSNKRQRQDVALFADDMNGESLLAQTLCA